MKYQIIDRREVPPIPKITTRGQTYGEWLALARTLRMMPPTKAVALKTDDDVFDDRAALMAIHKAARRAGIKVTALRANKMLYVWRLKIVGPDTQNKIWEFRCLGCGNILETDRKNKEWCSKRECQLERERRRGKERYSEKKARRAKETQDAE